MKILVAGASGLIGTALVPALARTHTVHALARRDGPAVDNVHWHRVDLAAPPETWQLPPEWDAAIYLAQSRGYRDFPAQAADMMAVNVHAPVALLDASRRRGATRFVLASTANVYGQSHRLLDERQDGINPTTFYASTRRAAEILALPFGAHLSVTVARLFTVYGPGQRSDTLIASLIERVRAGEPVVVHGDRGLLLSPIFLSDAVAALTRLLERTVSAGAPAVVNVAGGEVAGLAEIASMIGTIVGREPVWNRVSADEPGGWAADTTLLRSLTGWRPEVALARGLQQTVAARAV
jgi:nucleoside-diphosphate-sugar epimerase